MSTDQLVRRRIELSGVVQGVGFRPHAARLASTLQLAGWVRNDAAGATIEVEGSTSSVNRFVAEVIEHAPPLAQIEAAECTMIAPSGSAGFSILESTRAPLASVAAGTALVPPDTGTCDACLYELSDPSNRRHRHAFICCTDCGPRWTIVNALPYDRPSTTMAKFALCGACAVEYHDPLDRRYHAQPTACHDCGPTLTFRSNDGRAPVHGTDRVVGAVQQALAAGKIVAIKGLGGYHLAVDASNEHAVERLRARKNRPDKPFAVMVRDLAGARHLAEVGNLEANALESAARPIVLLRARPNQLAMAVAPRSQLLGIMLAYTPLHHLLFTETPGADVSPVNVLVMTSGNTSGEPIVYQEPQAYEQLADIADAFCSHDRPILVPCDDSVVRIVAGCESPIRRSRGFAPLPIRLPFAAPPLMALGGDLKNTIGIADGHRALLSQHLGDMQSLAARDAAAQSGRALAELHDCAPEQVVSDRHPGYCTTQAANAYELPHVSVGHHHAHLAALMAEHQISSDTCVLGFVFDGTGWGDDDTLWGGEVLLGGYRSVDRVAHLAAIPLPGGEAAVRHPWRMALAYLEDASIDATDLACSKQASDVELNVVMHQIKTGLNSPNTTSMGRLFDAVASILDVRHAISYEAQAAIDLEHLAGDADQPAALRFESKDNGVISAVPLIRDLVRGLRDGTSPAALALGFHHAIAALIAELSASLLVTSPTIGHVGLTGGVFQNDLLVRLTIDRLQPIDASTLIHQLVPANDGGIALGQLAVAAHTSSPPTRNPEPT